MKFSKSIAAAAFAATTILASATSAFAHDVTAEGVFARPSLGAAKNSAVFMVLKNPSHHEDVLVEATGDVARRIELHTHLMEDGVMKMREIKGGIKIPSGGSTELKPGGLHIMLMGVTKPLKVGDKFKLTLKFKESDSFTITVPVKKIGAKMMHMKHNMKHKMKHKMKKTGTSN